MTLIVVSETAGQTLSTPPPAADGIPVLLRRSGQSVTRVTDTWELRDGGTQTVNRPSNEPPGWREDMGGPHVYWHFTAGRFHVLAVTDLSNEPSSHHLMQIHIEVGTSRLNVRGTDETLFLLGQSPSGDDCLVVIQPTGYRRTYADRTPYTLRVYGLGPAPQTVVTERAYDTSRGNEIAEKDFIPEVARRFHLTHLFPPRWEPGD